MKSIEAMKHRIAGIGSEARVRVSDDTMRWLFGTPDPALSPKQQFQQDFVGAEPDPAANRARKRFCLEHSLKAQQDKQTGYWTFKKGNENG